MSLFEHPGSVLSRACCFACREAFMDFIPDLVVLMLELWVDLARYNGVFAPNSKCRVVVTSRETLNKSG